MPEKVMEAEEGAQVRERGRTDPAPVSDAVGAAGNGRFGPSCGLSGQSYWTDFWLFLLFDLVLFVFVYLLP